MQSLPVCLSGWLARCICVCLSSLLNLSFLAYFVYSLLVAVSPFLPRPLAHSLFLRRKQIPFDPPQAYICPQLFLQRAARCLNQPRGDISRECLESSVRELVGFWQLWREEMVLGGGGGGGCTSPQKAGRVCMNLEASHCVVWRRCRLQQEIEKSNSV